MLCLSRKPGETIFIGSDIKLVLLRVRGQRAYLGIEAPQGVVIKREEIAGRDNDAEDRQTEPNR